MWAREEEPVKRETGCMREEMKGLERICHSQIPFWKHKPSYFSTKLLPLVEVPETLHVLLQLSSVHWEMKPKSTHIRWIHTQCGYTIYLLNLGSLTPCSMSQVNRLRFSSWTATWKCGYEQQLLPLLGFAPWKWNQHPRKEQRSSGYTACRWWLLSTAQAILYFQFSIN